MLKLKTVLQKTQENLIYTFTQNTSIKLEIIGYTPRPPPKGFQVAPVIKNPIASAGDARDVGQSLGREDPRNRKYKHSGSVFLSGNFHGQRGQEGYNHGVTKTEQLSAHNKHNTN